jgi:putative membrane protein
MNKIILVTAMAMVTTSAFAQSAAEKSGVNSLAGIPPKTQDFVTEVATSDMFEIESSKLAAERADAVTKTFAQQMIQDHQKTTTELKQLVDSGKVKVKLPTAMTDAQKKSIAKLKGLNGAEFTKQYHSDQEDAHEDAVDLFKRYGKEGENADLKAWAAKTVPALEHHLQMAEDLNK